jgi:predicted DNA-binding transcriptional regulator AlpA
MPTKTKSRAKTPAALITKNIEHIHAQALRPDAAIDQHDRPLGQPRGPPRALLTKAEVLARVKLSYPHVWRLMRANKFPVSLVLPGTKMIRWVESEIDSWIAALPRQKLKADNAA